RRIARFEAKRSLDSDPAPLECVETGVTPRTRNGRVTVVTRAGIASPYDPDAHWLKMRLASTSGIARPSMVQVQRQQGLPPVLTTPTGVTFHGRVLYPPGKWGRRRPVFPATVEVYRSTNLIPLWDTAETVIDGSFSTKQSLTTGTAD